MSKFTVIRTEQEVGIVCRIGSLSRFEGIFKGRFSDFHVNEIDLNGKIVQLTSLSPPVEQKSEIPEDDPDILGWISEEVRKSIAEVQKRLEDASGAGNFRKSDPVWKEKVEIEVTNLGKDERTKIHKWLGNFDKLQSETIDKDGGKYIVALYDNKFHRNRRRPAFRSKFTHCTMYKEGMDTTEAIGLLSKKLRIKPNFITFCGTKDKYGKTTQRICLRNIEASRLVQISREMRSMKLGNYEYLPHHLRLGDLKGNHFKILLRNVTPEYDESDVAASVESLKTAGFINYFGLQRFGSYEVSTHAIGKSILQNNWVEAFDLILKPKSNDSEFMVEAKKAWFTNRDANEAIKKFPHWHRSIESNLLHGLAKYYAKNDFIGTFLRLPRNVRHLYIHSFQSYLWNQVASFRIKEMGAQPVVGDIVYVDEEQEDFFFEEEEQVSDDDESNSNQTSSEQHLLARRSKVKTLTAEDVPNYTIFDVLIPMQGTLITIPDGHIQNFYNKLLSEQGVASDCFLKFKPISDQPKGAYRKLCVRPQNVSHKIIAYNDADPVDTFIPSEIDRLNEQQQKATHHETSYEPEDQKSQVNNGENPSSSSKTDSVLNKDKKCVIIEFSLPSSSYATMALREIMVTDADKEEVPVAAPTKRNVDKVETCSDNDEPDSKKQKDDNEK